MGLFDKFLDAVRMSDDYDEDDDFFDEEDDAEEEPKPKKRLFGRSSAPVTDDDDDFDDDDDDDITTPVMKTDIGRSSSAPVFSRTSAPQKVTPMRRRGSSTGSMEVCVIKPVKVEDYREIADTLLSNCTVVLNLEGLDVELAQRIIDFSSGSCYAINGGLQKVSSYIFILTPANVEISGDIQDLLNGAMPAMRNSI